MTDQQTNVALKIQSMLDRVAALTTADKLKSKRFDAKGERHAEAIAAADSRKNFDIPRLFGTTSDEQLE